MNIAQQTFGEHLTAVINAAQNAPMPPASPSSYHGHTENFFATLDSHDAQARDILNDHRLTEAGKGERFTPLNADVSQRLSSIESVWGTNTETYLSKLKRILSDQGAPDQGAQMNARADAQMILNSVEPEKVLDAMLNLAKDEDEAMRHLMLLTPFPGRYLTSIGRASLTALYDERKAPLMGTVLSEEGVNSLAAATRLNDARQDLKQALEAYVIWDSKPAMSKEGLTLS